MLPTAHLSDAPGRPARGRVLARTSHRWPWPLQATVAALVCGLAGTGLAGVSLLGAGTGGTAPSGSAATTVPGPARTPGGPAEIAASPSAVPHSVAVAATEPEATLTVADVLALPAGRQRADAIEALVRAWARRDPPAVAAWISTLPDPAEQHHALRAAMESTAERDPLRALAMADESGSGPDEGTLERIVRGWAQADLPAARLWLQTARTADAPLAAQVLQVWAVQDPAAAAQAAALLPDGPARTRTLSAIAAAWAAQDPGATAQWAASLPPADAQAALEAAAQALRHP